MREAQWPASQTKVWAFHAVAAPSRLGPSRKGREVTAGQHPGSLACTQPHTHTHTHTSATSREARAHTHTHTALPPSGRHTHPHTHTPLCHQQGGQAQDQRTPQGAALRLGFCSPHPCLPQPPFPLSQSSPSSNAAARDPGNGAHCAHRALLGAAVRAVL